MVIDTHDQDPADVDLAESELASLDAVERYTMSDIDNLQKQKADSVFPSLRLTTYARDHSIDPDYYLQAYNEEKDRLEETRSHYSNKPGNEGAKAIAERDRFASDASWSTLSATQAAGRLLKAIIMIENGENKKFESTGKIGVRPGDNTAGFDLIFKRSIELADGEEEVETEDRVIEKDGIKVGKNTITVPITDKLGFVRQRYFEKGAEDPYKVEFGFCKLTSSD